MIYFCHLFCFSSLKANLPWLAISILFCFVLFYLALPCLVSPRLVSSHLVSSHFISFRLISSRLVLFCRSLPDVTVPYHALPNLPRSFPAILHIALSIKLNPHFMHIKMHFITENYIKRSILNREPPLESIKKLAKIDCHRKEFLWMIKSLSSTLFSIQNFSLNQQFCNNKLTIVTNSLFELENFQQK